MVKIRSNAKDITNQKFYKLTAKYPVAHSPQGLIWHFECDCGNEIDVLGIAVRRGNTKSCGCLLSHYELEISNLLKENKYLYKSQYSFKDLKNIKPLRFDFAIFDNDNQIIGLIEYNGRQHYIEVSKFGGEERLKEYQHSDKLKQDYCIKNNIPLLVLNKDNYSEEYILNWLKSLLK